MQRELLGVFERLEARNEESAAALIADLEERAPELALDDPEVLEAMRNLSLANLAYAVARGHDLAQGRSVSWVRGEPAQAAEHARFMARTGIPLELLVFVYRRAQSVFWEIVQEEVLAAGLDEPAQALMLTGASRFQFDYFDHLLTVATEASTSERERVTRGPDQRRVEVVSRLLEGGLASTDELGYRLEGNHLAMVVCGAHAESAARAIAAAMDCESLLISRGDTLAWLWLGIRAPFDERAWERLRSHPLPAGVTLAAGESYSGIEGFRLSHRQAKIADRASSAAGERLVRYADVALLVTVLGDETARASFVELFLGALAGSGARKANLRETLRAYFSAGQNAASTAAMLGVNERTVRNRIRTAEQILGRPLGAHRPELEIALRIVDARGETLPAA